MYSLEEMETWLPEDPTEDGLLTRAIRYLIWEVKTLQRKNAFLSQQRTDASEQLSGHPASQTGGDQVDSGRNRDGAQNEQHQSEHEKN